MKHLLGAASAAALSLALAVPEGAEPGSVSVTFGDRPVAATHTLTGGRLEITLAPEVRIGAGESLTVVAG